MELPTRFRRHLYQQNAAITLVIGNVIYRNVSDHSQNNDVKQWAELVAGKAASLTMYIVRLVAGRNHSCNLQHTSLQMVMWGCVRRLPLLLLTRPEAASKCYFLILKNKR